MLPKRWHIYMVDLEPRVGTKPGKQRPCLAIQPSDFAKAGLKSAVVLPLTSRITPGETFPLRVRIKKGICNLQKDSDIMIDQILAWDIDLFSEDLGLLPEDLQQKVSAALRDFLDF